MTGDMLSPKQICSELRRRRTIRRTYFPCLRENLFLLFPSVNFPVLNPAAHHRSSAGTTGCLLATFMAYYVVSGCLLLLVCCYPAPLQTNLVTNVHSTSTVSSSPSESSIVTIIFFFASLVKSPKSRHWLLILKTQLHSSSVVVKLWL